MIIADKEIEDLYLTEGKIMKDKLYDVHFVYSKILMCSLTKIKYTCNKLNIPFVKLGISRTNYLKGEDIVQLLQPTEWIPWAKDHDN